MGIFDTLELIFTSNFARCLKIVVVVRIENVAQFLTIQICRTKSIFLFLENRFNMHINRKSTTKYMSLFIYQKCQKFKVFKVLEILFVRKIFEFSNIVSYNFPGMKHIVLSILSFSNFWINCWLHNSFSYLPKRKF